MHDQCVMCATKYYGIAHLEIWKTSMALSNLLWSFASWFLHHLISKLANCEQNLLEIVRHSLARSPECVVNHPEPLVMTNNMKKHRNFLFYRGVDAILQQPPGPERLH